MQPTFANTCLDDGDDGITLMAGSDEYLGTMVFISKGLLWKPIKGTTTSIVNIKGHSSAVAL